MSIKEISSERKIKEGFLQAYYIKDNSEILLSIINKNVDLDLHNHPHLQFGYCFTGKFVLNVNSKANDILTGDSYILAAEIPHSADAVEDFYALDFKYINQSNLSKELEFSVLKELFRENGLIASIAYVGSARVIRIQGTGRLDLLALKVCESDQLYMVASKKAYVAGDNESMNILPMKIYKADAKNLEIRSNDKEIFLICI